MHEAIASEMRAINQRLDRIERLLQLIAYEGVSIMTTQADIDAKTKSLNEKLTAETNAEKAVVTLLKSVKTDLDAVKAQLASANPSLDLSALDAIASQLDANAAAAAAAVVAGTPVAPTPVKA